MNLKPFKVLSIVIYILISMALSSSTSGIIKKKSIKMQDNFEKSADSLLQIMTLEEKIGQMVQVDLNAIKKNPEDITRFFLGSLLAGGGSEPDDVSAEGWANVHDSLQSYALKTRLKIPIIFGIDAVHGHNNVNNAVIFPHNIGLGATRNPDLVEKAARITAVEMAATGILWTFAPCIAVARDERWGRTYESFGETPGLAVELGAAAVKGYQDSSLNNQSSVLACAKHFVGDGGTTGGDDQGNTEIDEETLRKIHLPGYIAAIKENVGSIMVSYSSWNGIKMHANKYLLTDVLKNELGFDGILISDWAAIDQLSDNYKNNIKVSVNAGLDMVMIPRGKGEKNSYIDFIKYLKELVNEGSVTVERINDAVKRILKIKFKMDLFNRYFSVKDLLSSVGSDEHRQIARECVRQSLVLLKNENNILPLKKDLKKIIVAGEKADNIKTQCGGWTISWHGDEGELFGGTTILQSIKNKLNLTEVVFDPDGKNVSDADAVIVVAGEEPYAEGKGDKKELNLSHKESKLISDLKSSGIPVIVILISGRPLIVNDELRNSDAFIAAWLPGSEGDGIADVLFGDYNPTGKLPLSWPKNMQQIPINFEDENYDPHFPFGYGLSYD